MQQNEAKMQFTNKKPFMSDFFLLRLNNLFLGRMNAGIRIFNLRGRRADAAAVVMIAEDNTSIAAAKFCSK